MSNQHGEFLGAVRAAPPWHLSPHTLYIRESIRALDKRRLLHLSQQADAVETLTRPEDVGREAVLRDIVAASGHRLLMSLVAALGQRQRGLKRAGA